MLVVALEAVTEEEVVRREVEMASGEVEMVEMVEVARGEVEMARGEVEMVEVARGEVEMARGEVVRGEVVEQGTRFQSAPTNGTGTQSNVSLQARHTGH